MASLTDFERGVLYLAVVGETVAIVTIEFSAFEQFDKRGICETVATDYMKELWIYSDSMKLGRYFFDEELMPSVQVLKRLDIGKDEITEEVIDELKREFAESFI
jgi:hypothetical protein